MKSDWGRSQVWNKILILWQQQWCFTLHLTLPPSRTVAAAWNNVSQSEPYASSHPLQGSTTGHSKPRAVRGSKGHPSGSPSTLAWSEARKRSSWRQCHSLLPENTAAITTTMNIYGALLFGRHWAKGLQKLRLGTPNKLAKFTQLTSNGAQMGTAVF